MEKDRIERRKGVCVWKTKKKKKKIINAMQQLHFQVANKFHSNFFTLKKQRENIKESKN